ncbi:MAG: AAA family ATPase [Candidatus Babeliaceae bacterium]
MKQTQHGTIILLNGVSSSGKSAIIHALHASHKNIKILKVDDWFPDILKNVAQEHGWQENSNICPWLYLHTATTEQTGKYYFDVELREKLFNNSHKLYEQAKNFASEGQNVIMDTVLEYEKEYTRFDNFFRNEKVIKILVYCPLDILLQRVEQRNACGIVSEQRTAFQSFEQFPALFKLQEHAHEPVLDIVKSTVIKQALEKAIQDLIKNTIAAPYLPKLDEFRKKFSQQFKLDEQETITLVPRHAYNLILNSYHNSPQQSAQKILEIVDLKNNF